MNSADFALVLAAGKGTRMRSEKPKVLHTLLGESMLSLVLAALEPLFGGNILIVAGCRADLLQKEFPLAHFVKQMPQLGTGHALQAALPELKARGAARVTIINGDAPLITSLDLENFHAKAQKADLAFASITLRNPGSYGRVVRKGCNVASIVEAKDYDESSFGAPSGEVNAGVYSMDIPKIGPLLAALRNDNKSGEYYLTDLVALALEAGLSVLGIPCGENENLLGVNSPLELARAEDSLASRTALELLEKGVMLHAPALARISPFAVIEPGAEIFAPTEICGKSFIASGAVIDSHCVIKNSFIRANAHIRNFSHLEDADVGSEAIVGPYTRLRPGAVLEKEARAGNFVELKNARLGEGAKANHLAYLGDAEIGSKTNIGAGTITCNYDGIRKNRTSIGANAFIGSNTALVAPVCIGDNALVGAGSVITKNVPDSEMAIARGKQKNLPKRNL